MTNAYQTIHSFFDSYGLVHARSNLKQLIKAADSGKTWSRSSPCDALYFSQKINELIEAVFTIVNTFDQYPEIILDKDINDDCWLLTDYDSYCGCHLDDAPWDFFPRHLGRKEFLDPYKVLEKFTHFRNMEQWKEVVKDLLYHALSDIPIDEFGDSKSILRTFIHLNRLIEATHLIEVRLLPEQPKPRRKWSDRKADTKSPTINN